MACAISVSALGLEVTGGTLHGELWIPAGDVSCVVLLWAGSGPTDRYGNQPGLEPNSLRLLAQALCQRGIAVLLSDKRGVGASRSALQSEYELTSDVYAEDAACWTRLLRSDTRFSKVIFVGHSEGALIGALAAQKEPVNIYVALCAPAQNIGEVLNQQLSRHLRPHISESLWESAITILNALKRGERVSPVPPELMFIFRETVQPYLISWLQYEPVIEVHKLKCLTYWFWGSADAQVSPGEINFLNSHQRDKTHVIEGMNHMLCAQAPSSSTTQLLHPQLPIFLDQIIRLAT
jgi:uncharacterized protein